MPALASSRRRLLAIVGKIPGPMLRALARCLMRAAMAGLSALTPRFRGAFAVIGEIAGAMLPTNVTSSSSLFPILGEVPRVSGVL